MIFWPILLYVIFLLDKNACGATSSVIEAEHRQLDKNLKILRKDFNKLVENVEDFAEDFLMQVHETGRLVGNTFINEDYNWQDDKDNSILKELHKSLLPTSTETSPTILSKTLSLPRLKLPKIPNLLTTKENDSQELQESLLPTSTETSPTILSKTLSLPKLKLPKIPNLLTADEDDSQEISNHIDATRKKRSPNSMIQEFMGGRPPMPPMEQPEMSMDQPPPPPPPPEAMDQRDEQQRQHVPPPSMPEKARHRQMEQVMQDFPPFTDKTIDVMEAREKPEGPGEGHKRAEQEGHSQARQNPFFAENDPLICSAKTQKELELEKQKMEKLKEEVKKLNELVSLLKDQQKVMQVLNNEDASIEHNEVFGNLKNDIENTFLYKALKQLDNKQRGGKSLGRHQATGMRVPIDDISIPQKLSDSSFEDLQKIKLELRNTEEVLNQTKDALINEKRKEEILEREIKRQSSELKFLKVMTENLYDKIGTKSSDSSRRFRASEVEDIDVDSILASIHNGSGHRRFGQTTFPRSFVSSMARRDSANSDATERPLTRDEQIKKDKKEKSDKMFGEWENKLGINAYFENLDMNLKNKETTDALIELSKHDPNRFNMFHLNSRASTTGDNRDTHMHKLAEMFNHGSNKNKDSTENGQNKDNSTDMLMNARASSSGKSDDIDFKLKLAEMLQNEAKNDDSGLKEKLLSEEMKKLVEPEKKSNDDPLTLEALIALAKERREEPKQETITKETLKELLKELVPKPQEKSDDMDVKNELKALHKAIISLKQKEDTSTNNLDFNSFGNNRKGKQEDIQGNLKKLIKELQNRPQKKSDDLDVAIELKELQKAISSLRPKEQLQDNFDLNQFENNNQPKKPNQEEMQQFQSALSQLLAGGSLSNPSSSFDSAGSSSNIDLSTLINANNGGNTLNNGPINVPSVIPNNVPQNTKLTPQQLIQLSKFMGTHNHNMGSGGSFNNLDGSTNPNIQQLLNSLNVPSNNMAASKSLGVNVNVNGGIPNQGRGFPNQGSPSMGGLGGASPNKIDINTLINSGGSASPKPNGFNVNQLLNGGSHSMGSMYGGGYKGNAAYGSMPYSNSYPAANYGGNSYGVDYNNYMGPYYSKPGYSDDYDLPHFVFPNLHNYDYDSSYTPPKKTYSAPGYPGQGNQGYGGGKTDYGAPSYGGGTYQVPANDYGVSKGGYGGPGPEENEVAYQSFSKPFFLSPGAGQPGKYGGGYHGNKYGSKSYGGPGVDQSYGNGQNVNQYKDAMEADLAKQIEGLEGAITGLNKGDYTQNPEDKATVASLENRIHELKGVIRSLNKQPAYGPSPSYYAPSETAYKQPPHSSYKSGSHSHPYGSSNKHGALSKQDHGGAYPSSYPVDQPSAPPAQPYGADSPPGYEASYGPDQQPHGEGPPSPYQSAEGDSHPGYPSGSTYQAKASARDRTITRGLRKVLDTLGASAKSRRRRSVQDQDAPRQDVVRPEVPPELAAPEREQADMSFEVRQSHDVPPEGRRAGFDIGDDPLIHIANTFKKYLEENLTEAEPGAQPTNTPHPEGRASAMDGLREKLETLKKQLESPQPSKGSSSNMYGPHGLSQNIQTRGPAYGGSHDSMDLDNHHYNHPGVPYLARPYVESKPDVYPHYPPAPIVPYAPYSYGNSYPIGHQYQSHEVFSFDKSIADKKQDIFTKIVLKILEKILGALPDILERLFGKVITSIGDAHGDYYSPLQTLFKNLGALGFIPLVLIRLIETQGSVVYYLSKNKFVRKFLIPLVAIIGAVLLIFFLVYFYQQDEPYGYIEYQGKNYDSKYPQYEAKPYSQNNYRATDHGARYPDPYMSNNHKPKTEPPHYIKPIPYATKLHGYNHNSDSKKTDAYTDNYFDDSYNHKGHKINDYGIEKLEVFGDKKLDNYGAPSGYYRGYYDYFDNSLGHNRYEDEYR